MQQSQENGERIASSIWYYEVPYLPSVLKFRDRIRGKIEGMFKKRKKVDVA